MDEICGWLSLDGRLGGYFSTEMRVLTGMVLLLFIRFGTLIDPAWFGLRGFDPTAKEGFLF